MLFRTRKERFDFIVSRIFYRAAEFGCPALDNQMVLSAQQLNRLESRVSIAGLGYIEQIE